MPLSRRTFLAGSAAAFGFKNETLDRMAALPFAPNDAEDEEFWMRIRGEFNIDPNLTSFNHAGLSPSPRTVLETIASEWKRANVAPSFMIWRKQDYELDTVRKQLAEIVGCKTEQLALTMNATYGLQTAILGVPMSAGDEILATEHEYSRALTAMDQRGRRDGVVAVVLPLKAPPENQEEVAKQILAAVTDKTKLILLSQMTFLAGTKMPIRLVANALKGRDIPILVDGAHGIGLLPDQFSEQGGDIYTACLHKWMMCPIGTGVFVATQPWIRQMWPLHPAEDNLNDSITKFEQIGSRPAAPFLAIKDALAFHNLIGRERKAARLEALRNRLAEKVLNLSGVHHFGSLDTNLGQVLLTVGFDKAPAAELAGWLLTKHRIHVTTVLRTEISGIRISPHIFTTLAEIDQLAGILADVAKNGFKSI